MYSTLYNNYTCGYKWQTSFVAYFTPVLLQGMLDNWPVGSVELTLSVCVCEREWETERDRDRETERQRERQNTCKCCMYEENEQLHPCILAYKFCSAGLA